MRPAAAVLPRRPRLPAGGLRQLLLRLKPSRRSLVVGCGIVALAPCAYAVARETSVFAVESIDVRGGGPRIDVQVRRTLGQFVGTNLLALDGAAVLRRIEALPTVVRASYDRTFPHTLRVTVVPERPVAVLRLGSDSWLLSVRGRVIGRLAPHAEPHLPRIWVPGSKPVRPGSLVAATEGGAVARALGLAGSFGARVASASYRDGSLVFRLRSGIELVLGDTTNARLKAAVAARTLPLVPTGTTFLDVSVPGRPVSGTTPGGAPTLQQSSSRG
jgi:cell division protein FtsQ